MARAPRSATVGNPADGTAVTINAPVKSRQRSAPKLVWPDWYRSELRTPAHFHELKATPLDTLVALLLLPDLVVDEPFSSPRTEVKLDFTRGAMGVVDAAELRLVQAAVLREAIRALRRATVEPTRLKLIDDMRDQIARLKDDLAESLDGLPAELVRELRHT